MDSNTSLVISNCVMFGLFLASEILGYSSCPENSVCQFIFTLPCSKKRIAIDVHEVA